MFARWVATHGIHPIAFVVIAFIFAAIPLLLIAGPGTRTLKTLKNPGTWIYAALSLFEHMTTICLFIYVTGTEGSLMQRLNVIVALLISWFFMNQTFKKEELVYLFPLSFGLGVLFWNLPSENAPLVIVCLLAAVLFQVGKTLVAELSAADFEEEDDLRTKVRVAAIVSFCTSMVFLMAFMPLSFVKTYYIGKSLDVPPLLAVFPSMEDFVNPHMVVAALVFAVVIEAPSIFAYFYSVRLVGTNKFMAFAALVPLFTLAMEYMFMGVGLLRSISISMESLAAMALISLAAFMKVVSDSKKK